MDIHNETASLPAVLPRMDRMLTAGDHQDIKDFTHDLEEAVRDLEKAAKKSTAVREKAGLLTSSLESRSWWGQLTSGLSGGTDKELADLVQGLGVSLGVTQKVVQVVLKVMTQKNRVLHAFNEALVNKIALVTADTRTVDSNQKVAVKSFLTQLQKHVFEQIQQQEMVDSHELRLTDQEAWREDRNCHDQAVGAQLAVLEESRLLATEHLQKLDGRTEALVEQAGLLVQHRAADRVYIESLEKKAINGLDDVDSRSRVLANRLDVVEETSAKLTEHLCVLMERAQASKAGLSRNDAQIAELQRIDAAKTQHICALEQRLLVLEQFERASRTTQARLLRYGPAAVALLLGAAALYLSVAV